ncbi:hypothetical protein [Paenibacillus sp. Marseille-Q4541]|uniref:hypothetical protein n=1 Tax=Paenibacillus sp. Marseille-Q4541 TaxID=2831522 RepID=UPI001BA556FF|nr:hypothetical protein [Paenibacillus sp. Marseille-Q4541]
MTMIGLDFYGTHFFRSPGTAIRDMYYGELKNGTYDELEIREATNVNTDSNKSNWEADTRAIFKFIEDLEGGNIANNGLEIVSFQIKRRRLNELDGYTLATIPFENNKKIEYIDYTQPNGELIYSIVPLAENALDGKSVEIQTESMFVGWWIVDKETNNILPMDKSIGSMGDVETSLQQGRTVIETLTRYPTVFYSEKNYHEFSLSTVITPEEFNLSGLEYEKILNDFIYSHKPCLVKSSDGRLFICDVHYPKESTPQNTWKDYDYKTITFDFTEIGGYDEYMRGEL